jgi:hypothetical protein
MPNATRRGLALAARLALCVGCVWACAAACAADAYTGTDPATIRAEMAKLRRATDWANPDAVKAANARMQQLNRQLEQGRLQREAAAGAARGETAPTTATGAALPLVNQATVMEQVQAGAQATGGPQLLLTEALRQRIAKDHEEERNTTPNNPRYLAEMPLVVIDFSQPAAPLQVQQLALYKAVSTLVLTGGARGAPIDLAAVLAQAQHLPLHTLLIINFRQHLADLPDTLAGFKGLRRVSLINNALTRLPPSLAGLPQLSELHLDLNPLTTVWPTLAPARGLRALGLSQTRVSAAERAHIAAALPACKVLTP